MYIKKTFILSLLVLIGLPIRAQYGNMDLKTLFSIANGDSYRYTQSDRANAQFELGRRMYTGEGGATRDLQKAINWFYQSANLGNRTAQYARGIAYHTGEGVAEDYDKALYWYEQAAKKNEHNAAFEAGMMYFNGEGITTNPTKAANYFKDAAFGGIPKGMYYYAYCFAYGYGVKTDSIKAVLWLDRAIENKYYSAYCLLGQMYEKGIAVKKDLSYAIHCYENGDSFDDADCQYNLAYIYLTGTGVEQDSITAMDYYIKAANNGKIDAAEYVALTYGIDDNQFYDPYIAMEWTKLLISYGYEDYYYFLAHLYMDVNNYEDALNIYEGLISKGDPDAYNELAYIYARGRGVNIDFKKAISLIDKAIKINPDNLNYLDSKGEIYTMMGDIKNANKVYKKILSKQPHFFQNWRDENGYNTAFYEYMKSNGY